MLCWTGVHAPNVHCSLLRVLGLTRVQVEGYVDFTFSSTCRRLVDEEKQQHGDAYSRAVRQELTDWKKHNCLGLFTTDAQKPQYTLFIICLYLFACHQPPLKPATPCVLHRRAAGARRPSPPVVVRSTSWPRDVKQTLSEPICATATWQTNQLCGMLRTQRPTHPPSGCRFKA